MQKRNKIKRLLAEYGRKIGRRHLVMGAMGNISAREGEKIWIKRAGTWLEKARPEDFIAVNMSTGKARPGQLPSKEIFLHLGCFKVRADIGAVTHTHPVISTALATAGVNPNKKFKILRKIVGSKLAILPYYPPGSRKLAREVRGQIKKVNAVILANHGLVTVGKNIKQAYARTCACEEAAKKILARLRSK